jgi:L,D-peptidoglycan transpeptidase YkuD (ErfK/YbiS/YcfS/YnhG family)
MPSMSGPSMTRILLTLAAVAVGVIAALFGISVAVGALSAPAPVKVASTPRTAAAATRAPNVAQAAAVATIQAEAASLKAAPKRPSPASAKAPAKPSSAAKAKAPAKPKPATRPKPRHVPALPDRLHTLGAARQVVIVTSSSASDRDGTLELYDKGSDGTWRRVLSSPTRMGRKAMVAGTARHQGSSTTPTGSWIMPSWGFGWAGSAPSGSRLGWKQIKSTSYWSAEPGSSYNTWVTSSSSVAGERLRSAGPPYEFAIDSGYNAPPNTRVYGRGTAIFIHVMHPGYTAGCISLPRAKMIELLTKLDPGRHPRCVVGTTDRGTSTSLWAY